ncbi:TIM barrel protein [Oscillospiraceae bacterium OttesenSCG-928-F05]|nr:TIM barrel protein [Oscillospiraceae bacterium OttesenSCG-928-F05]
MKVALQLYSVKDHLKEDGIGTMRQVADIGYKYIEPFGFPKGDSKDEIEKNCGLNMSLADAKAFLKSSGIQVIGGHYYYPGTPGFETMCAYYAELGAKQIGSGGDFFPGGMDELKEKLALMVKDAEIAKKYGLRYYYHNHFWEYQKFGDRTIMEILQDETGADTMLFELDTYWAARGGIDIEKEIARIGDRLILMHQKDYSKTTDEKINLFEWKIDINKPIHPEDHRDARHVGTFAEVGTGILPIQSYIDAGNKVGVEYIILEQDLTAMDELESIKISMEAFKKFKGLEWD